MNSHRQFFSRVSQSGSPDTDEADDVVLDSEIGIGKSSAKKKLLFVVLGLLVAISVGIAVFGGSKKPNPGNLAGYEGYSAGTPPVRPEPVFGGTPSPSGPAGGNTQGAPAPSDVAAQTATPQPQSPISGTTPAAQQQSPVEAAQKPGAQAARQSNTASGSSPQAQTSAPVTHKPSAAATQPASEPLPQAAPKENKDVTVLARPARSKGMTTTENEAPRKRHRQDNRRDYEEVSSGSSGRSKEVLRLKESTITELSPREEGVTVEQILIIK